MIQLPQNAPPGFDWVTSLKKIEKSGLTVKLELQTARSKSCQLNIQYLGRGIWNIRFVPQGVNFHPPETLIQKNREPRKDILIEENSSELRLSADSTRWLFDKNRWSFTLCDKKGHVIAADNPKDVDGLGKLFILPLGFIEKGGTVTASTVSFHLRPDEHLYGLGEKFTRLDKVGQKIISWTRDALGSTGERSHKNVPFLMSSHGYGILMNSTARITWELGTVSTQSFTILHELPFLDLYLITGKTLPIILKKYYFLTGKPVVPPKWSFGLWISSAGTYRDQPAIQRLVQGVEKHKIPADVIHIDTWWMRWRQYCDFQWDHKAFPDVKKLIADLHSRKLKISLWIQPYISVESPLYEIGKSNGYFVKRADGDVYIIDYGLSLAPRPDGKVRVASDKEGWNAPVAIVDFTNSAACNWFKELARPVLREGIDNFKTDFGEDIPEDAVFSNGQTGKTSHNLYPLLYNKAIFEVTREEKGRGLVWARSGFTGSQKYPVCWSGDPAADWDSLAATIRGGLSLGMSGIPFWSNDIGGYRGIPSEELYIRWAQFGLLCSHSRMHADSPREPWYFGGRALKITKKYIQLRYQLFPYIYSTALMAQDSGLPVIRSMPLVFPENRLCHSLEFQYMLGPSILVAPVFRPDNFCAVYLPEGEWVDFYTHKTYQGPANLNLRVPLEKIPLFIRAGSIIPMMKASSRIPEKLISPLIINLYPLKSGKSIYLDDQDSIAFQVEKKDNKIVLRLDGRRKRDFILKFYHVFSYRNLLIEEKEKGVLAGPVDILQKKRFLQVSLTSFKTGKITILL